MSLRDLVLEIHRRSVWQVVGLYIVSAVAALEVVDIVVAHTALPVWFPTSQFGNSVVMCNR